MIKGSLFLSAPLLSVFGKKNSCFWQKIDGFGDKRSSFGAISHKCVISCFSSVCYTDKLLVSATLHCDLHVQSLSVRSVVGSILMPCLNFNHNYGLCSCAWSLLLDN